jgi:hypothetical protein
MILKPAIPSLEGLPEPYHALYTLRDGQHVLTGVEGYTPEDRDKVAKVLKTERESASAAANALKPWKTLFGDRKPEEIQEELDRTEEYKLASKGKLDETELETRVEARLKRKVVPFERAAAEAAEKLALAARQLGEYEARDKRAKVREAIREAALASGADPKSYSERGGLLAVCEGVLEVADDGKVATRDGAGYPVGLDASALLKQIQPQQPYFWPSSQGSGAGDRPRGSAPAAGQNPWKKEHFNRSEQMRIMMADPALAKQYQAAAASATSVPAR